MYLTMNRFRVRPGQEEAFEAMWANRDSHLKTVPGFVGFHLMRGEAVEGATLYASHTLWSDRDAFLAWTKSEAFRAAHRGAKTSDAMYDGAPVLECFESVQSIAAD
jgi:heme-degrading monooxygenase HmoA